MTHCLLKYVLFDHPFCKWSFTGAEIKHPKMQFKAKIQDRTILFFFTQLISIVGVYYTARIKGICNSLFGSFEDQFVWAMNFAHLSFSKICHALFTFSPYFSLCVFFFLPLPLPGVPHSNHPPPSQTKSSQKHWCVSEPRYETTLAMLQITYGGCNSSQQVQQP